MAGVVQNTAGWPSSTISTVRAEPRRPWASRSMSSRCRNSAGSGVRQGNVCYAAIEHDESTPDSATELLFLYVQQLVFAKQLANMAIYCRDREDQKSLATRVSFRPWPSRHARSSWRSPLGERVRRIRISIASRFERRRRTFATPRSAGGPELHVRFGPAGPLSASWLRTPSLPSRAGWVAWARRAASSA